MKCFCCNREMFITAAEQVNGILKEIEKCDRCGSQVKSEYSFEQKKLIKVEWKAADQ